MLHTSVFHSTKLGCTLPEVVERNVRKQVHVHSLWTHEGCDLTGEIYKQIILLFTQNIIYSYTFERLFYQTFYSDLNVLKNTKVLSKMFIKYQHVRHRSEWPTSLEEEFKVKYWNRLIGEQKHVKQLKWSTVSK